MPKRAVHVTIRLTGLVDTTRIDDDASAVIASAVESLGGTHGQAVSSAAEAVSDPALALELQLTTLDVPSWINRQVPSAQLMPLLNGPWVQVELLSDAEAPA